jgi:hypothetical protein
MEAITIYSAFLCQASATCVNREPAIGRQDRSTSRTRLGTKNGSNQLNMATNQPK